MKSCRGMWPKLLAVSGRRAGNPFRNERKHSDVMPLEHHYRFNYDSLLMPNMWRIYIYSNIMEYIEYIGLYRIQMYTNDNLQAFPDFPTRNCGWICRPVRNWRCSRGNATKSRPKRNRREGTLKLHMLTTQLVEGKLGSNGFCHQL